MKMSIYQKGNDDFGKYWRIKVGKGGLNINLYTTGINLTFGFDFQHQECAHWFSIVLGPLFITYFFKPKWD